MIFITHLVMVCGLQAKTMTRPTCVQNLKTLASAIPEI